MNPLGLPTSQSSHFSPILLISKLLSTLTVVCKYFTRNEYRHSYREDFEPDYYFFIGYTQYYLLSGNNWQV